MSLLDDFDDALEWGSSDDRLLGPEEPVDWFPPDRPAESAVAPHCTSPRAPSAGRTEAVLRSMWSWRALTAAG